MKVLIGNIFDSSAQTIVNTVNCVGVMGKGIAEEFKKRYPEMFDEYVRLCQTKELRPGVPYLYTDIYGTSIINFPTKNHWKSPSKLSYITEGLEWFVQNYEHLGITSIAFPPLGCGNGGLKWELVGPLMYQTLSPLPIEIEIYAPYGTKPEYLKHAFLSDPSNIATNDITGSRFFSYNPKWDVILYVVQELAKQKYAYPVGRTIFQKICFILTRTGIDTGFTFRKGAYGPYSEQVKDAIAIMSNANLITEESRGQMVSVNVTPKFCPSNSQFTGQDIQCAHRTIDLFLRIKDTAQAEMIATVIFDYDTLSQKNSLVTEMDVYNDILAWKPRWKGIEDTTICDTIRNLSVLGWIFPRYSPELPCDPIF